MFPDVIWHTEIPILRTAPVPLFMLSELVRQNHYKVVLTGEGADEILAGYDIFKEAKIRRFWARQPDSTAASVAVQPPVSGNFPHAQQQRLPGVFLWCGSGEYERPGLFPPGPLASNQPYQAILLQALCRSELAAGRTMTAIRSLPG